MPLFLTDADVRAVFEWPHAIAELRKFQGWLQGYNGGPLRQPTQRIHDPQMLALRKGLIDAGLNPSMDPFRDFFIGRNPGS
jgi:4-hydroxy-tetrahydrodipicolinate synthase